MEPLHNLMTDRIAFRVNGTYGCCGQCEIHSFTPVLDPFPAGGTRAVLNRLVALHSDRTSYHFTHHAHLSKVWAENLRNGGAKNVVEIPWKSLYETGNDLITVFFEVRKPGDENR